MKKIHALLVLGGFLLVAGLGGRFYAYPALAVIPADLESVVVAQNPPGEPATYFSMAQLSEVTGELGNQTQARVDAALSEEASEELGRDVLVVRTHACTDDIAIDCSTERYALSATLSTFAVDPSTGEPVAWDGATIETGGEVERGVDFQGLTIKFPFDAQERTYEFWNADLRTSVPVEFVGRTSVDGLAALEYRSRIEPTVLSQIDIPGSIIGLDEPTVTVDRVVSSETTYVVEPESGVIISATSVQDSYAELEGEKVLTITDGTFTTPADVAADTVDTYRPLSTALFVLRVVAPLVGGVGGPLLIGLALLLRIRRSRAQHPASTVAVPGREPVHVG